MSSRSPVAHVKTLADCHCVDGEPRCFHCERPMPQRTPVEVNGTYLIAYCVHCGCMTPFPVEKP